MRRLRWLLPAVLLVVWLAIAAIGGPYSGKLAEVQRNDTVLVPAREGRVHQGRRTSRRRSQAQQTFPAFLLLESDETLTPDQLAAFRRSRGGIPGVEVPVKGQLVRERRRLPRPRPGAVVPSRTARPPSRSSTSTPIRRSAPSPTARTRSSGPSRRCGSRTRRSTPAARRVYVAGPAGDHRRPRQGVRGHRRHAARASRCSPCWSSCSSSTAARSLPFFVLLTSLFALAAGQRRRLPAGQATT